MSLFPRAAMAALAVLAVSTPAVLQAQCAPITLAVDLTDAPRRILHATETMPAQPGPMTLVYPKWIPGEHGPTGPIDNQAGFIVTTQSGERVKWERDPEDMFTFHITVPQGATALHIKMDFLATAAPSGFSAGASTSANLALLSWNELVVYPGGKQAGEVMITPSLTIPAGWQFGTALEPSRAEGDADELQAGVAGAAGGLAGAGGALVQGDSAGAGGVAEAFP